MPQQFDNPANIDIHARTTAQEILADFAEAPFDVLITGVGTGGHITALRRSAEESWPGLKVFAVEPTLSPVISGGAARPAPDPGHRRRLHPDEPAHPLLDGAIPVEAEDAKEMARRCAREEGLLVGISSGATLAAIEQKLAELAAGSPRARLQLRHRRALSVGAGLPAGVIAAGRGA